MVHFTLGTIYTFGNMAPYIVSYIHNQSQPADLTNPTSSWIFACALIGQGGAMFAGGWLVNKIGPRFTTLLGGWIMSTGVALSYFSIKVSFWLLLLTYGIMFGIGVGVAYIGPLTAAMKWMPKWKGLANGVVVAGFGLGALGFNAVQTFYINPENEVVDKKTGLFKNSDLIGRVPWVFLIMGGTYAVMQLIGSLLITNPPAGYGSSDEAAPKVGGANEEEVDKKEEEESKRIKFLSEPSNEDVENGTVSPNSATSSVLRGGVALNGTEDESDDDLLEHQENMKLLKEETRPPAVMDERKSEMETSVVSSLFQTTNVVSSLSPRQVLTKLNFYILWFMFLSNGMAVMFTATLYKIFGQGFIHDDHFLAIVGSVSAIFNCSGRIVWGLIADLVSYKFCLVVMAAIMTMFMLTFYSTILGGKAMYFIWVCVIFFCVGGNFSLFPTAVGRAFGIKYAPVNYGMLFTSQVIAGALGATLSTLLTTVIGFYGLMFLVSGISGIGMLLAIIYKPKRYVTLLTTSTQ